MHDRDPQRRCIPRAFHYNSDAIQQNLTGIRSLNSGKNPH